MKMKTMIPSLDTLPAHEIYQQHIKPLPQEKRLRLLAMIAQDIALDSTRKQTKRNIMELHGLGKELWQGVDAQEYVNQLREEWEHRV